MAVCLLPGVESVEVSFGVVKGDNGYHFRADEQVLPVM